MEKSCTFSTVPLRGTSTFYFGLANSTPSLPPVGSLTTVDMHKVNELINKHTIFKQKEILFNLNYICITMDTVSYFQNKFFPSS